VSLKWPLPKEFFANTVHVFLVSRLRGNIILILAKNNMKYSDKFSKSGDKKYTDLDEGKTSLKGELEEVCKSKGHKVVLRLLAKYMKTTETRTPVTVFSSPCLNIVTLYAEETLTVPVPSECGTAIKSGIN
jgi:hypothetical protein